MLFPRALFSFLCAAWSCQWGHWGPGDELLCERPDSHKFNTKLQREFATMHLDAQQKLIHLDGSFDRYVINRLNNVCVEDVVDNQRLHESVRLSLTDAFCANEEVKDGNNASTRKCTNHLLHLLIRQSLTKLGDISKCYEVWNFMDFMKNDAQCGFAGYNRL